MGFVFFADQPDVLPSFAFFASFADKCCSDSPIRPDPMSTLERAIEIAARAHAGDNMDLSRIAAPTEKDYARLREYEQVRALLLAAL